MTPKVASAQDELGLNRDVLKYLFEAEVYYDHLNPYDDYGSWTTGFLRFYAKVMPVMTAFAQLGGFSRKEGKGLLGIMGTYKDWDKFFPPTLP